MPRKLDARMTLDATEDEILYTSAALEADPDAKDLVASTSGWLPALDKVRARDRDVRQGAAKADATRAVSNVRLDHSVVDFGDDLHAAVKKDHSAPRWLTFFKVAVSIFVKSALPREVETVKGWLGVKDAVLEKHRAPLTQWSTAAENAIVATRALGPRRGEVWQAREELADALTRERDGLHAALTQRANERTLPREWANTFFRVELRAGAGDEPGPHGAPTPAATSPAAQPAGT